MKRFSSLVYLDVIVSNVESRQSKSLGQTVIRAIR
jgi:hypothetical protein